jgi:glycosyltransferase involved in cell wall biosynthesis
MTTPLVTVVVPSFNQGQYLNDSLQSIFEQSVAVEVFVIDGGSSDNSLDVIRFWEKKIAGWRSYKDDGQAAAINEGIALGTAPYVCWLNSDDRYLAQGLTKLVEALDTNPEISLVYGHVWNIVEKSPRRFPVWVEPFNVKRLAIRCIISQPGTLIRRSAWDSVGGVDASLTMAMDYDLWWRFYSSDHLFLYLDKYVAINRLHPATKTNNNRRHHYKESMGIVKRHHGKLPLKWWILQPYSVWWKSIVAWLK